MKKVFAALAVLVFAVAGYRLFRDRIDATQTLPIAASNERGDETAIETRSAERPARPREDIIHAGERRRPSDGAVIADPEVVRANLEKLLSGSAASASRQVSPANAQAASNAEQRSAAVSAGKIGEKEARMLGAYERMATALADAGSNCDEMGRTVLEIVQQNRATVADLTATWSSLTPEQRGMKEQRIEQALGPQLDVIRQAFRTGLARCPNDAKLNAAFRTLADPNEPLPPP